MLELLYSFIVYIIGCVLAYGRFYASMEYAYRKGITDIKMTPGRLFKDPEYRWVIFFSWMTFAVGISIYFEDEEDTFLKFKP